MPVNLLLLLSALLSALTGVQMGTRGTDAPRAVAHAAVAVRSVPSFVRAEPSRFVAALPGLDMVSAAPIRRTVAVVATEPFWTSRRRE